MADFTLCGVSPGESREQQEACTQRSRGKCRRSPGPTERSGSLVKKHLAFRASSPHLLEGPRSGSQLSRAASEPRLRQAPKQSVPLTPCVEAVTPELTHLRLPDLARVGLGHA